MNDERKPILCIDFDGVIHSYERGWQDGDIYGSVTEGFWKWAHEVSKSFQLVVYSSRSKDHAQRSAMEAWLKHHWQAENDVSFVPWPKLLFAAEKPPAWLTIDDRGVTFRGSWSAPELSPQALIGFTPWNVGKSTGDRTDDQKESPARAEEAAARGQEGAFIQGFGG